MRNDTSAGRAARKSILMSSRTLAERKESCGKQHCASIPWRIRLRCLDGAAENKDQT
jgi:hypothetical protein